MALVCAVAARVFWWTHTKVEVLYSVLSQQKRKRKDAGSHCNGTDSPKRHRESVLRLTGEDGRDGGPAPARICLEESGEDGDSESLDRTILQFTVGAHDQTEVLVPIISPDLEAEDFIGTPIQSPSSSQDNTTKTSPSEPSEYTNTGWVMPDTLLNLVASFCCWNLLYIYIVIYLNLYEETLEIVAQAT